MIEPKIAFADRSDDVRDTIPFPGITGSARY
jgi:hypothetical protein